MGSRHSRHFSGLPTPGLLVNNCSDFRNSDRRLCSLLAWSSAVMAQSRQSHGPTNVRGVGQQPLGFPKLGSSSLVFVGGDRSRSLRNLANSMGLPTPGLLVHTCSDFQNSDRRLWSLLGVIVRGRCATSPIPWACQRPGCWSTTGRISKTRIVAPPPHWDSRLRWSRSHACSECSRLRRNV
jgi:hypothetical protein